MNKTKGIFIPAAVLTVLVLVIILWSTFGGDAPAEICDTVVPSGQVFAKTNSENNFTYTAKADIGKQTKDGYISLTYSVDMTPNTDRRYEKISATGFIPADVFEEVAIKSYDYFGTGAGVNIVADKNDPMGKGFSIGRATWVYGTTDISALEDKLKQGLKIMVKWDGGAEYVTVTDITIIRHEV